jgi:hypothetical protein
MIRLEDQILSKLISADMPFSFLYGDQHSSQILSESRKSISVEKTDSNKKEHTITYVHELTGLEIKGITL